MSSLFSPPRPKPEQSRGLLVELFEPLAAQVDVEHLLAGFWGFWMALGPGATDRYWGKGSCTTQVLGHQGEGSACDGRKTDQIDSSQEVVQG